MKNVQEWQKKKCIFLPNDEFDNVIRQVIGKDYDVQFTYDGLIIENIKTEDCADMDFVHQQLAKYYDVKEITSIHMDDCDVIGVWICYND